MPGWTDEGEKEAEQDPGGGDGEARPGHDVPPSLGLGPGRSQHSVIIIHCTAVPRLHILLIFHLKLNFLLK